MIHVPNVRQAFLLGGYPQKQSEIHGSIASMDPYVPRWDKRKGFAGRVAYRFYMFDWFPSRGIEDVICNWCFFLANLAESSRMVFLNCCFLLIIGRIDISFHMYKLQVVEVKEMMCQLVQIKVPPSVSARI